MSESHPEPRLPFGKLVHCGDVVAAARVAKLERAIERVSCSLSFAVNDQHDVVLLGACRDCRADAY